MNNSFFAQFVIKLSIINALANLLKGLKINSLSNAIIAD